MRAGEREGEPGADMLAGGSDAPKLAERLPERWRRRAGIAVALLIGLAVGGYAGYTWPPSQAEIDRRTVRLTARIGELDGLNLPYPPYRLTLEVRNTGPLPVTLERAQLSLPRYDTFSTLGGPRELRPDEPVVLHYGVYPACDRAVPGSRPPSVRLRVRLASGEVRTVTLPTSNTGTGLRSGYAIVCALPPVTLGIRAQTLDTSVQRDGRLSAQLRLTADPSGSRRVPDGLRLLDVGAGVAGIGADSDLPGQGTRAMPSAVSLRLRVEDCGKARQSLDEPVALRVAFVSAAGPRLVYAHTDAEFAEALQAYVADRCGNAP